MMSEVSLREYLESRIVAVEKAIDVASEAMLLRLESMNEFRSTLKDQAGHFVTRDELETKLSFISEQLKDLQLTRAKMNGKASQKEALAILVIAMAGLLLSALSLWLR